MQWKDSSQLSASSLSQLFTFTDLILRWNARINLTGYRRREEIENLLVGESIQAAFALQKAGRLKPGTRILDFGSGAGIPGLVWSMLDLPIDVTSLEIRQKKVAFQKEVVRGLGLKARIVLGRFPEPVLGDRFDLIVSRAIRFDSDVWEQGKVCLDPGGMFVRFAALGAKESGWDPIPISERTSLLVQSA